MNRWNAFSTLIQKQPTWPRYLASNFFNINWLLNSYLYNYQFTKESLRQCFQVNDSNWNRVISDMDRPRVSTQLLGTVPFGNAKRSNWVFFRIRTQLEPSRGKWWNDASKWVRIGSKRSSKKIDWIASSALLLFAWTPARQISLAQFLRIISKWSRSRGNSRPICT